MPKYNEDEAPAITFTNKFVNAMLVLIMGSVGSIGYYLKTNSDESAKFLNNFAVMEANHELRISTLEKVVEQDKREIMISQQRILDKIDNFTTNNLYTTKIKEK
jgi:hypothetical protein